MSESMVGFSSPLTSPDPSQESSAQRPSKLKRQRIDSEDDESGNRPSASQEDETQPAASSSRRNRAAYSSEEEEGTVNEPAMASPSYSHGDHDSHTHTRRLRTRRGSATSSIYEEPKKPSKKQTSKLKGKTKVDGPPKKKTKKAAAHEYNDDLDMSDDFGESEVDIEAELEELAGVSEEEFEDQPRSKGKAKGGGRGARGRGVAGGGDKKAAKEIVIKAKDESGRARSGSAPLQLAKATRSVAKSHRPPPTHDEMEVDVVGASSPSQTGEGSQTKDDKSSTAPTPAKKRKLFISKKKTVESSAPNTPATASGPSKPNAAGTAGDAKGKDAFSDIKPTAPAGTRKPAAYVGVADLDLSDKNTYAELFSTKGTNASGSNRRAKDEERRKELDAMRKEWKAKRDSEQMQTPPFDLQAQAEKLARFEERLRSIRSSAVYPNFLASKWRELWERERERRHNEARAREREAQGGRHQTNGVATNGAGYEPDRR
ncbi:hypothetical protein DFP72DRAFT_335883 [Ephemerocybe angulata]|uniref:Uncharacterized protein n=1 Tax=Ephemerocybe angulata TaxID=980116 RepID=A0A8H6IIR6_9AGAR|nr:hypothetical protein DFP72DRAFT_335883 [Tulosesus angulatus]